MSRLEELIKEKCPNGVKYKKLYEITNWDKRFNGVSQDMQTNILSYKHVSAELLKSLLQDNGNIKLLSTGLFDGYTTEELANDLVNEGEVISIPSGGAANIKYYNGKFVDSGNNLASSRDDELYNLKYIFYVLQSKNNVVSDYFRGSGVKHPSMPDILKIDIPVPPIEVQEEIVRILDKFGKLEAELEAELEARKQQYEYWRNNIFELNNKDYKIYELQELFELKNGYTPSTSNNLFWINGTIPWFRMEDIRLNGGILKDSIKHITPQALKKNGPFKANSVICATSATIGVHALIECDFLSNQRFTCMTLKNEFLSLIDMKYIYYYCFLLDQYCKNNLNQGNFSSVDMNEFKKFKFKIPSLGEQQRIVNILDKFDKLVNNISEGLPGEIELRRKQYEYYRNQLLSFKELNNG